MNNPIILKFLQEFVNRLAKKNPTFFNYLAWVGTAAAIVTGLPEFLTWLGISLPSWATILENKAIAIAGIVTVLISNLTVQVNNIPEEKKENVLPLTTKKDGV